LTKSQFFGLLYYQHKHRNVGKSVRWKQGTGGIAEAEIKPLIIYEETTRVSNYCGLGSQRKQRRQG
jgi:hypothetical protein